ncbi:MAG: hypothetical protein KHX31_03565 [Akkermansia sp.]|uniref:hypothetical protein n=1 Tax=Akkermansia sp. TaxID=1872421 RepID=UPI0025B92375|nr:hypothetical protein [Akkermansia sp.]MBS5507692.1 hypothetical protein [Akkermansia sp.]
MDALQRGNVRLQKGMLVPGPFCRKRGVDSFAFRISLSRQALSFVFRPTGLFRFPLRKNYRRNRKDSFSAQSGPFPASFFFLAWRFLQNLKNCCKTRYGMIFQPGVAAFFSIAFPWPEHAPVEIMCPESLLPGNVLPNLFPNPALRRIGKQEGRK